MKIGLRTIKTVITATLGIFLAQFFQLQFPSTAGIVAILSVTNTKKSSFKIGIGRVLAFIVATFIAYVCYHLLGFHPLAFGVFLLCYIPIAARFNMSEAIPVNSVLMTHFLNEGNMSMPLVLNAFYLLAIGVSLALIANLYMPDKSKEISESKEKVDRGIKELLFKLSELLTDASVKSECELLIEGIAKGIKEGQQKAIREQDNRLLSTNGYHMNYFDMRYTQLEVLEDMYDLIRQTTVTPEVSKEMSKLLIDIGSTYAEENDALELKQRVLGVYGLYEMMALPTSRKEFENRARLYQLLMETQTFIDIKLNFSNYQQ